MNPWFQPTEQLLFLRFRGPSLGALLHGKRFGSWRCIATKKFVTSAVATCRNTLSLILALLVSLGIARYGFLELHSGRACDTAKQPLLSSPAAVAASSPSIHPQNQQFQHCSTIVQYTSIPNNPKPSEAIGSACQEYCLFRSTCIRDLGKHRFLTIINHTPTKHATLILLVKAKHCLRCPEEITSGFFIGDMVTSVNLFTPE